MSEATDNVEAPAEAPDAAVEVADSRPEWLPEKFNTPEDLVTSYSSLESKLGKGQDELRESIMGEIESEALELRRNRYIAALVAVDNGFLERAKTGDPAACKLVFQRFEGLTEKKNISGQTDTDLTVNIVRLGRPKLTKEEWLEAHAITPKIGAGENP